MIESAVDQRHHLIWQAVRALGPQACLDYPILMSICDAAAWDLTDADAAMQVLVATLSSESSRHGDMRNATQDYHEQRFLQPSKF